MKVDRESLLAACVSASVYLVACHTELARSNPKVGVVFYCFALFLSEGHLLTRCLPVRSELHTFLPTQVLLIIVFFISWAWCGGQASLF